MIGALENIALHATADISAVEVGLRRIPNDDPKGTFAPAIIDLIRTGKAKVFEIVRNGAVVGFTVYQIENFGPNYKELISVATHCPHTSNLRYEIEAQLLQHAKNLGCQSIRMHTVRQGLVKEALDNDWHVAEIVLRKSIK